MKVASENLLKKLSLDINIPFIEVFVEKPNQHGKRGKFFWSQRQYDKQNLRTRSSNYALLDSGLVVAFTYWVEQRNIVTREDLYFLGEGVFHSTMSDGFYYNTSEKDYK